MPFKDGIFQHELGFTLYITNGQVYINGNWPLSVRITDIINTKKWREIKDGSENQG